MIGRTVTPGELISISRNVIPCCGRSSRAVRTRKKPQFAISACVFQIFCPVQMRSSSSSSARIYKAARSDPAPGSE